MVVVGACVMLVVCKCGVRPFAIARKPVTAILYSVLIFNSTIMICKSGGAHSRPYNSPPRLGNPGSVNALVGTRR